MLLCSSLAGQSFEFFMALLKWRNFSWDVLLPLRTYCLYGVISSSLIQTLPATRWVTLKHLGSSENRKYSRWEGDGRWRKEKWTLWWWYFCHLIERIQVEAHQNGKALGPALSNYGSTGHLVIRHLKCDHNENGEQNLSLEYLKK